MVTGYRKLPPSSRHCKEGLPGGCGPRQKREGRYPAEAVVGPLLARVGGQDCDGS